MVFDISCSKREGIGNDNRVFDIVVLEIKSESDHRGERASVKASSTNGVINVDGANIVLGGYTNSHSHQLACPPSVFLLVIGYILIVMANISGVDPIFLRVSPLNRQDLFFIGEKLVLEKLESPLILFYFKKESKTRKRTLKK